MKRLKWMGVESRSSMRDLAKRLQKAEFKEGVNSGFLLERARDNFLDARYIERMEFTETLIDPFGRSQVANRVLYIEVDFTLTDHFPELELRMAPRGLSAFMNSLMKASNFSMSIEKCNIDLLRWTKAMGRTLGVKPAIKGAIASDIELAEGAVARIGIVAPKDARAGLAEVLMNRKHKLSNLQIEFPFRGASQRMLLSSEGSIRYPDAFGDTEIDAVREALREASGH